MLHYAHLLNDCLSRPDTLTGACQLKLRASDRGAAVQFELTRSLPPDDADQMESQTSIVPAGGTS